MQHARPSIVFYTIGPWLKINYKHVIIAKCTINQCVIEYKQFGAIMVTILSLFMALYCITCVYSDGPSATTSDSKTDTQSATTDEPASLTQVPISKVQVIDTTYSRTRKMYKSMYLIDTSYADFSTIRPEMSSPNATRVGYIYAFRGLVIGIGSRSDIMKDCEEAILVKEDGTYDFSKIGNNVIGEFFGESKLYKNPQKDANIGKWFDIISEGCDTPQKMSEFLTVNPEYQGSPLSVNNYHLSLYGSQGYKDRSQINLEGIYSIQPPVGENTKHATFMEFACTSSSDVHATNSQAAYDLAFVGHLMQARREGPAITVGSIHRLVAPFSIMGFPKSVQTKGQLLDGINV